MPQRILVDTGIWYAMFSRREASKHDMTDRIARLQSPNTVVVPWPTVYETLRTRFVKERQAMVLFHDYLAKPHIDLLDVSGYRSAAFALTYSMSVELGRPISMVDCLIRLVLEDRHTLIDSLMTLNVKDFEDTCEKRNIVIL